MYARVLRKWSLQKFLMFYLWLPVAMLLVICSQNATSMHLPISTRPSNLVTPDTQSTVTDNIMRPHDGRQPYPPYASSSASSSSRSDSGLHHQQTSFSSNYNININNNNKFINNNNNMRPPATARNHQYPYEVFIKENNAANRENALAANATSSSATIDPNVPNSNSQIINLYNSLTSSANIEGRSFYKLLSRSSSKVRRRYHSPVREELPAVAAAVAVDHDNEQKSQRSISSNNFSSQIHPFRLNSNYTLRQTPNINSNSNSNSNESDMTDDEQIEYLSPPAPLPLHLNPVNESIEFDKLLAARNRRASFADYTPVRRRQQRRYCSARDPAQLAFEAPTVFEGKIISMSYDRHSNFSVSFEVKEIFKKQIGYTLQKCVRLQFTNRNNSGECDIYREFLRPRGLVRGDKLEQKKLYVLFVQQIDSGNFTILGQPIRKTRRVVESVRKGVSENYAQPASIKSLTASSKKVKTGEELRVVCRVRGQPPPKVTWFKDDKSINRNRTLYKFVHYKKRSELIITSFNSSDAGLYECRAKNKVIRKPERRTIRIEAFPRPRYESAPPQTVDDCKEGQHLFCLNGGTCKFFKEFQLFSCICPDGFNGDRCQEKQWTDMPPSPTYKTGYIADDPTVIAADSEEEDDPHDHEDDVFTNDDELPRKDSDPFYNKLI